MVPAPGAYHVTWQVPINEPAQLGITVDGIVVASTITGRATGTVQLTGTAIVRITSAGSLLGLRNVGDVAFTVSSNAGGISQTTSHMVVVRVGD